MRNFHIDPSLFISNRERLSGMLGPGALAIFNSNDVFPRSNDQNFRFRQNSDLFYMTGLEQEKTILMLFPGSPNPDLREVLFILHADASLLIWEGHKFSKEEAKTISGISNVKFLDDFEAVLTEAMSYASQVYLNSVEYIKYFNEVPYRDLRFGKEVREKYPNHEYHRLAPLVYGLRTIKSTEEIRLMRKAIEITGKAFRRTLEFVKPGVMEYQVQAEIEREFLFNGAKGNAYLPIVASGKNGCVLHYIDNQDVCKDGDLLLMDIGAEYANYAADLTRTIPVSGRFSPRQRACYEAVLRVQKKAIQLLVPGNTIDKVNKEVNLMQEKEMIGLGLFSEADVKAQDPARPLYFKYYMHGTSHFLGLDVHDVGSKFEAFRPGMVFTSEPGIYISGENIGIRLENNILVSEEGPIDLTADIPIEPDEIEAMMGK